MCDMFFLSHVPPHPPSTLFPYTTLFRSPAEHVPVQMSTHDWPPEGPKRSVLMARGLWPALTRTFAAASTNPRSEEHTSELQSPDHVVCRLLLAKKNGLRRYTLARIASRS